LIRTIVAGAMLIMAVAAAGVSAETTKKADTAKVNTAKVDTTKAAAAKADTAKAGAAKVNTAKVDTTKAGAAKVHTAKADTAKAAVKADTTKKAVTVDSVAVTTVTADVVETVVTVDSVVTVDTLTDADTSTPPALAGKAVVAADNFAYHKGERSRMLSIRNDLMILIGEVSSFGLNFEFGMLDENGFLLSLDAGAGVNYYGVGVNVGYSFTGSGNSVNIIGVSGNFHNTELVVRVRSGSGPLVSTEYGKNRAYGGIFWKIMPLENEPLDITNRFLFGYKRNSAWWDGDLGEITFKKGFSVTYSLTAGYTLMKRSK